MLVRSVLASTGLSSSSSLIARMQLVVTYESIELLVQRLI